MNPIIVQKFGGTSVATPERIRVVATRVAREVQAGKRVVVVVSAMSGQTNQLVEWATHFGSLHSSPHFDQEYDVVVASGEQVTSGLTALALQEIGIKAKSLLSWQVPIETDTTSAKARIQNIPADNMLHWLNQGYVVVVPGFQGLTSEGRLATLGRGGSDTTAVALAAALGAEQCDIFTDVDGVYTTDPRIVPAARKLDKITYEEMFEMASLGSKVLQTRSVEMAMKHNVRLQVLSSFIDAPGTWIVHEEEIMEKAIVSGIAFSKEEARISLHNLPDRAGICAAIFGPLAEANINVDMIVLIASEDRKNTSLTFTLVRADLDRAQKILAPLKESLGFESMTCANNVSKISIIGVGMRSHVGVAQTMFKALAEKGINIDVISTSEIKVSAIVSSDYLELAVRALHTAFDLDQA